MMSAIRLDLRVVPPTEPAARRAADAIALLTAGRRAEAEGMYRDAVSMAVTHRSGWINLAALAVGLGEWQAACAHAAQALNIDRGDADAWVNLGVARWNMAQRREGAHGMQQALTLAPGMETAALNLSLMHRAAGQLEPSKRVLAAALGRNPDSVRLLQAMAEVGRLAGDTESTRLHALRALTALLPSLRPVPTQDAGPEPEDEAAQARLLVTMKDACDRLQAAGIDHNLVGGVVVGIVRQGRPFAGDKDVDIGIPFEVDRDAIAAAFKDGYRYMQPPGSDGNRWCMAFLHESTGIGVDLFFRTRVGGKLRFCLGWPDNLEYDWPDYAVAPFHWAGRDWPMPAPLEHYLAADYGEDWRSSTRAVAGHTFDKRWLDSQISSPALVAESIPRAVNLVLLRLLATLRAGRWEKALALCAQLAAREAIGEVADVRERLLAAGIR